MLGLLAALAVLLSALPDWAKWLLVPLCLASGLRLASGHLDEASFEWTPSGDGCSVRLRGTLAVLECVDAGGRTRRWQYWPDTLSPAQRRRMRLLAQVRPGSSAVVVQLTT